MSQINPNTITPTSSASVFAVVTPSNTTALAQSIKSIYCTTAGNLVADDWSTTPNRVTIAMEAGQILPIRPQFVRENSTGAFIALFD